jgi:hypothetical protein
MKEKLLAASIRSLLAALMFVKCCRSERKKMVRLLSYLGLAALLAFGSCIVSGCGGGDSPLDGNGTPSYSLPDTNYSTPYTITTGPSAGQSGTIIVSYNTSEDTSTITLQNPSSGATIAKLTGYLSPDGNGSYNFGANQNGYMISGGGGPSDSGTPNSDIAGPGTITLPDGSTGTFNFSS